MVAVGRALGAGRGQDGTWGSSEAMDPDVADLVAIARQSPTEQVLDASGIAPFYDAAVSAGAEAGSDEGAGSGSGAGEGEDGEEDGEVGERSDGEASGESGEEDEEDAEGVGSGESKDRGDASVAIPASSAGDADLVPLTAQICREVRPSPRHVEPIPPCRTHTPTRPHPRPHPHSHPHTCRSSQALSLLQRLARQPSVQYHLNGVPGSNSWILKPAGKSRGRGIRCFNDLDRILEYSTGEEAQWVAQKYIENPLLILRRKFDIRQWVLVTAWNPLTVWIYDVRARGEGVWGALCLTGVAGVLPALLRGGVQPAGPGAGALHAPRALPQLPHAPLPPSAQDNNFVHLSNNSIQKKSDRFGETEIEGNMWASSEFAEHLRRCEGSAERWENVIRPQIMDVVRWTLLAAREAVEHRENTFEVYGFDLMVDELDNVRLIEVNSRCGPARLPAASVAATDPPRPVPLRHAATAPTSPTARASPSALSRASPVTSSRSCSTTRHGRSARRAGSAARGEPSARRPKGAAPRAGAGTRAGARARRRPTLSSPRRHRTRASSRSFCRNLPCPTRWLRAWT